MAIVISNVIKKVALSALPLSLAATLLGTSSHAEGSKDLYPDGASG